ncbi:hypothetical protein PMI09_02793 [Rhizobium sp. CF122]|nr:hypothetical protein PMI09_02793 [Rhizobium sp. CF122]
MIEGSSKAFRRLQKVVPSLNSTFISDAYLMAKAHVGIFLIKYAHTCAGKKCFAVRRLRVPTIPSSRQQHLPRETFTKCLVSFTVVIVRAAPDMAAACRGQPKITPLYNFPKQQIGNAGADDPAGGKAMKKLNDIDPDLREAIWHALRRAGITSLDRCVAFISAPDGSLRVASKEDLENLMREPTHH